MTRPATAVALLCALGLLAGCGAADRLANVGKAPDLSRIEDPNARNGFQTVRMPMPAPEVTERQPNSLWRAGSRAFFRDQRASRVGDLLTVRVSIQQETAELSAATEINRADGVTSGITNLFGFQRNLRRVLPYPDAGTDQIGADLRGGMTIDNDGTTTRTDTVTVRVAAVITQVLPNGNFVIDGSQEVRVNFELRELRVQGVIRPEDIGNQNEISHDRIAEARIVYSGRGQITDVQQPRYGTQVLDILSPF
jgi:flagellar L-ring protein precursor FlgH